MRNDDYERGKAEGSLYARVSELEKKAAIWEEERKYRWIVEGVIAAISAYMGYFGSAIAKKFGIG